MMKREEASGVDGDTHATRRERNSKSGTLGDWGIQEARTWPTRAASRFSRILDNPDVPVRFRAVPLKRVRLPPGFLILFPRTRGAEPCPLICLLTYLSIPRTRGAKENAARPPQKRSSGTQFGGLKNT